MVFLRRTFKYSLLIVMLVSLLTFFVGRAYSHPMDNTDTYIQISKDYDDSVLDPKVIKIYSYISWYIAGDIYTKKTNNKTADFEELLKFGSDYSKYVYDRFTVVNNTVNCVGNIIDNPQNDSLSMGALVVVEYKCPTAIQDVQITNTIAHDIFELPTNFMTVQEGSKILERISLGKQSAVLSFDFFALQKNPVGDVSVDFTQNYTVDQILNTQSDQSSDNEKSNSSQMSENLGTGPKVNSFLATLADAIFLRANSAKDQPLPILMLFVFLLGLLHTLEAGHSKAVLTSNLLNNKISFKRSLLYVFVFTATHLGDIIFIGILFLVLNNFYNIFSRLGLIEQFAGFTLLLLSAYMLVKNIIDYIKLRLKRQNKFVHIDADAHDNLHHDHAHDKLHHDHSHSNMEQILSNRPISIRDQIAIGILTGIAPCIFGWSIFMLVISTGNLWILFPVIFSFGAGIFIALTLVAFFVTKLRSITIGKITFLADISPIISALFLLIYSIMIIR